MAPITLENLMLEPADVRVVEPDHEWVILSHQVDQWITVSLYVRDEDTEMFHRVGLSQGAVAFLKEDGVLSEHRHLHLHGVDEDGGRDEDSPFYDFYSDLTMLRAFLAEIEAAYQRGYDAKTYL